MPLSSGLSIHDDTKHKGDAKRGAASGVAGLDGDARLNWSEIPLSFDGYSNHLGAVDNYTEIDTYGNGSANTDAPNHEMDLSTGVTVISGACFNEKTGAAFTSAPHVFTALIQNIVNGAAGVPYTFLGFADIYPTVDFGEYAVFYCIPAGTWRCGTYDGATPENTDISPLVNGDLVTIIATSSYVEFYVNDVLVATHTTGISSNVMEIVTAVKDATGGLTSARSISIDLMSVKRYV